MNPNISMEEDTLKVQLYGEIDHHAAKNIREMTDTFIQQNHPRQVKLDFSHVSFMDSSGIGLIMGRYRMMSLCGGTLRVVNVPESLRKMMTLSGLDALQIIEKRELPYDHS